MLQNVLFREMNTSILGTPCDIGFYWKDGGLEKLYLRASEGLIWDWVRTLQLYQKCFLLQHFCTFSHRPKMLLLLCLDFRDILPESNTV